MFKLMRYEAQPVGKWAVGIRLKCLLVVIVFGLVIGMIVFSFRVYHVFIDYSGSTRYPVCPQNSTLLQAVFSTVSLEIK